jgi:uncharacterized protein (TIGR02453 family)
VSDGFEGMIGEARCFFARLREDNIRDFYEAHKAHYTDRIRKPAELLAGLFAEDLARATGVAHGAKVFRIHRDVRFSADKMPYNTHLHILWSRRGAAVAPVWFFGVSPDYLILAMGVMDLEKEALARFRRMVDAEGDDLTEAMEAAAETGAHLSDWGPEPLKRVPKPWDEDYPHADLLRRKAFALEAPLHADWEARGLLSSMNALLPPMLPLWRILGRAFRT